MMGLAYIFSTDRRAIRGKTVDGRQLRVVVSFDEETGLLIITAIALGE